jgi:hypothetical protein
LVVRGALITRVYNMNRFRGWMILKSIQKIIGLMTKGCNIKKITDLALKNSSIMTKSRRRYEGVFNDKRCQ